MSHTLKDTNDLAIKTAILRSHPVGSIYWSFQKTDPASLFGGTWERVKDTFILRPETRIRQGPRADRLM